MADTITIEYTDRTETMDALQLAYKFAEKALSVEEERSERIVGATSAMESFAFLAMAEQLKRIADVLEMAASDGIRIERERGE